MKLNMLSQMLINLIHNPILPLIRTALHSMVSMAQANCYPEQKGATLPSQSLSMPTPVSS